MKTQKALSWRRRQVFGWGVCWVWGSAAEAASTGAEVRLPPPSDAIILRWDRLSAVAVAGAVVEPVLLVHADGRYSVPPRTLGGARVTARLTPTELKALLTDVVMHQRFATLRSEELEAQLRTQMQASGGLLHWVRDGGVTRIEVKLPTLHHVVQLANAHAAYQQFPQVEALQRLHAIQQRLLVLVEPPSVH